MNRKNTGGKNTGKGSPAERELAERLKREAEEKRPAFSEDLHRRIMQSVEERGSTIVAPTRSRRWIAAAAVLVVAVTAFIILAALIRTPETTTPAAPDALNASAALADLATVAGMTERAASGIRSFAATLSTTQQWQQINLDVHTVASLLTDSLPLDMLSP